MKNAWKPLNLSEQWRSFPPLLLLCDAIGYVDQVNHVRIGIALLCDAIGYYLSGRNEPLSWTNGLKAL